MSMSKIISCLAFCLIPTLAALPVRAEEPKSKADVEQERKALLANLSVGRYSSLAQTLSKLARLPPQSEKPPPAPKFPFNSEQAAKYQQEYAQWRGLPVEVGNRPNTLVLVPPGEFVMGSPEDEPGHNAGGYEETLHRVTLTKPFYLCKHETTVGQFRKFVESGKERYVTDGEKNNGGNAHDAKAVWIHRPGTNWLKPGYAVPFELKDEMPVVHVSHTDSLAYCKWLNETHTHEGDAWHYDLPTEAQWEWACRAGNDKSYWWGSEVDDTGKRLNVGDQTLKKVHSEWPRVIMPMNDGYAFCAPVGSYQPNGFGLCDMLGNVWEFCSTRYGPYPREPVTDPTEGDPKRGFAVRGGGWSNVPTDARCGSRNADPPHFCHSNLGFRVALKLK